MNNISELNPLKGLKNYHITLASASPRRRELLSMLDIPFEVIATGNIDENYPADLDAAAIPEYLALKKASAHYNDLKENELCITADTIVIVDGKPIGKPQNKEEACQMLKSLSDKIHDVVTGVALSTIHKTISFSTLSKVSFDNLDEEEINYYIEQYRPFDKAGSYGIQEWIGGVAIKGIDGSFYNVMGLPLHRLFIELKTLASE